MTKEITKAKILQEMGNKFGLREFEPEIFTFSESVVPVYNIEQHLQTWEVKKKVLSVTSTNGELLFTVPMNEKWYLRAYNLWFLTGVYTIAGVYILRTSAPSDPIYLDLEADQVASKVVTLFTLCPLHSGDGIYVNIDGYTSTGNLQVTVDCMVEEIR